MVAELAAEFRSEKDYLDECNKSRLLSPQQSALPMLLSAAEARLKEKRPKSDL